MTLCFSTKGNNTARIGTFKKVRLADLKRYVHQFERHWINA